MFGIKLECIFYTLSAYWREMLCQEWIRLQVSEFKLNKIMCISLLTNLKSSNHLKKLKCKAPNMDEYHLRRSTDGTISFTIDMWVRMLLSTWFDINCNILINVITGCAIHILDSGLVVCYLVHLLVHINNLSYERSEIQLPFSSQNAWVSAPILFLALYADLATWQLCGSLWHHVPL